MTARVDAKSPSNGVRGVPARTVALRIQREARQRNVEIALVSEYSSLGIGEDQLFLRYSGLTHEQISAGVERLARANTQARI